MRWSLAALVATTVVSCEAPTSRPSVLLFVFDTTRVDAVSAYGRVSGTTPTADALAANGLRYTHAYAQAPWTLPSHATLFTGLLPSQHGVGWRHTRAPDTWVTLAERLHDAGYETVGAAENPWLNETFNMTQGFERFTGVDLASKTLAEGVPDVRAAVTAWVHERKTSRPFLLFVNVIDAHNPYAVRPVNPFLPSGVDVETARAVPQDVAHYLCSPAPHARELEILRGLYLGGVAAADLKLRDILGTLRDAGLDQNLVTIVTSDHGEHFGEHRLVHHQFSVHEALLHVPLIVEGMPGVAPGVIDSAVRLSDIMPTILRLAGVGVLDGLAGRALPTVAGAPDRPVIAEGFDLVGTVDLDPSPVAALMRNLAESYRRSCTPNDRVFGDMRALVRYPLELISYANYSPEAYDLSVDPDEQNDLAPSHPELVADLGAELLRRTQRHAARAGAVAPAAAAEPVPPAEVLDRLRALGYVGDRPAQPATH